MDQIHEPGSFRLRKGRVDVAGHYYFITFCTADRRPIFGSFPDAAGIVLDSIGFLNRTQAFRFDAAVVMPDHVHFSGAQRRGHLRDTMHSLKSYTANRIATRFGVAAPVWQAGYYDRALRRDEAYRASIRYLLNNPVRAGLVENFREYPHWWCRFDV